MNQAAILEHAGYVFRWRSIEVFQIATFDPFLGQIKVEPSAKNQKRIKDGDMKDVELWISALIRLPAY